MGWRKGESLYCVLTCVENARDKYLPESGVMHVGFSSFLVDNHHYVYWAFRRSEESDVGVIVNLCVGWCECKLVGVELD
jgi:hypothetical protein